MSVFEEIQRDALDTMAMEAVFISTKKSRERKITDYQEIDKAINGFVTMLEKWISLTKQYVSKIPNLEATESAHKVTAMEYVDKFNALSYARKQDLDSKKLAKTYLRNSKRWKDRADSKKADVIAAEKALAEKANTEYRNRLLKMVPDVKKLSAVIKEGYYAAEVKGDSYAIKSYGTAANRLNNIIDELRYTIQDVDTTLAISKKYGKFEFDT